MKIVTSGNKYIDIDAYASCISYSNFLKQKGIQSKLIIVLCVKFNLE